MRIKQEPEAGVPVIDGSSPAYELATRPSAPQTSEGTSAAGREANDNACYDKLAVPDVVPPGTTTDFGASQSPPGPSSSSRSSKSSPASKMRTSKKKRAARRKPVAVRKEGEASDVEADGALEVSKPFETLLLSGDVKAIFARQELARMLLHNPVWTALGAYVSGNLREPVSDLPIDETTSMVDAFQMLLVLCWEAGIWINMGEVDWDELMTLNVEVVLRTARRLFAVATDLVGRPLTIDTPTYHQAGEVTAAAPNQCDSPSAKISTSTHQSTATAPGASSCRVSPGPPLSTSSHVPKRRASRKNAVRRRSKARSKRLKSLKALEAVNVSRSPDVPSVEKDANAGEELTTEVEREVSSGQSPSCRDLKSDLNLERPRVAPSIADKKPLSDVLALGKGANNSLGLDVQRIKGSVDVVRPPWTQAFAGDAASVQRRGTPAFDKNTSDEELPPVPQLERLLDTLPLDRGAAVEFEQRRRVREPERMVTLARPRAVPKCEVVADNKRRLKVRSDGSAERLPAVAGRSRVTNAKLDASTNGLAANSKRVPINQGAEDDAQLVASNFKTRANCGLDTRKAEIQQPFGSLKLECIVVDPMSRTKCGGNSNGHGVIDAQKSGNGVSGEPVSQTYELACDAQFSRPHAVPRIEDEGTVEQQHDTLEVLGDIGDTRVSRAQRFGGDAMVKPQPAVSEIEAEVDGERLHDVSERVDVTTTKRALTTWAIGSDVCMGRPPKVHEPEDDVITEKPHAVPKDTADVSDDRVLGTPMIERATVAECSLGSQGRKDNTGAKCAYAASEIENRILAEPEHDPSPNCVQNALETEGCVSVEPLFITHRPNEEPTLAESYDVLEDDGHDVVERLLDSQRLGRDTSIKRELQTPEFDRGVSTRRLPGTTTNAITANADQLSKSNELRSDVDAERWLNASEDETSDRINRPTKGHEATNGESLTRPSDVPALTTDETRGQTTYVSKVASGDVVKQSNSAPERTSDDSGSIALAALKLETDVDAERLCDTDVAKIDACFERARVVLEAGRNPINDQRTRAASWLERGISVERPSNGHVAALERALARVFAASKSGDDAIDRRPPDTPEVEQSSKCVLTSPTGEEGVGFARLPRATKIEDETLSQRQPDALLLENDDVVEIRLNTPDIDIDEHHEDAPGVLRRKREDGVGRRSVVPRLDWSARVEVRLEEKTGRMRAPARPTRRDVGAWSVEVSRLKPISGLSEEQTVAESYEECIFCRFGASEATRHDHEPGFMSDFFRAFSRLMEQRQRAMLTSRPQASGSAERVVQTITGAIKMYVEDEDQRGWDEQTERLTFALTASYGRVRRETPFFLVHGWDPRTTIKAALSVENTQPLDSQPRRWRLHIQKHYMRARAQATELPAAAIGERADAHNEQVDPHDIEVCAQVWLYLDRVKPGYARKLARMWHGLFRVEEMVIACAVKLAIAGTECRVYPVVHISKLMPVRQYPVRPPAALHVPSEDRLDFDEELLPEDSWTTETLGEGIFEVEEILEMRTGRRMRYGRHFREFKVKWKDHDDATGVDEAVLNCGELLYDFLRTRTGRQRFGAMQSAEREDTEEATGGDG